MSELEKNTNATVLPAQYYVTDSAHNDEIDLLSIIASILKQWKLILVILLMGIIISYYYSSNLTKQYENHTIIRAPLIADLQVIELNGYGIELNNIFLRLYNNLKSPEVFKQYLIESNLISEYYPQLKSKEDLYYSAVSLTSNLTVNFGFDEGKAGSDKTRIKIKLMSSNENIAIKILNKYILNVEKNIFNQLRERGKYAVTLRKQAIEAKIAEQRNLAKQIRLNAIVGLKETLNVANIMGVTNALFAVPATSDLNTNAVPKSKTLNLYLNQVNQYQKYMMGSDYLNAEINRLQSRGDEITADDPFIPKIPTLLAELSKLNQKSFEFGGAKLFILDKLAAKNDAAIKPDKSKLMQVGFMISLFIALLVAIIITSIQKYKQNELEKLTN